MAELEITYIPYGLDEISQLDLMTSLANGIDSYLGSKNWAKKDKYRQAWLNAYQDIMNRGIIGASNDTGMWRVNHKGADIDMSGMSNIQREMYGDAAYYIQLLMARMTPRVKEEDKKKDENKTKFDNAEFNSGLTKHIGLYYGGMDSSVWNKRWAELDPEERGIRGTAGRQAKMAELLASFRDKIKADLDKYSFEDTPYGSFDEWNNRVERALKALRNSEWNDDDKNALDALGINYDEWFKTGADEPVTLTDGSTMTRAEFNALEDKLNAEKVATETAAKNKQFHLENDSVLSTSSGNKAIDAVYNTENYNKWLAQTYGTGQEGFNKINSRVQLLLEKSYNLGKANGLNQAERKELGNLLHYIRTNNPKYLNYNLTPEEEGELSKHNSMKGRRLLDFVRLPWQTSDGRYTYVDKSGNVYFLKPGNKKLLLQQPFTKSLAYNDYVKNFGKNLQQISNELAAVNMNTAFKDIKEFSPEMLKELEALAWDAASIIDPEAFSGSAMALNAARLRGEANPNRGLLEKVLDYGTAGLGGILGFGDLLVTGKLGYKLYQLGKSIGSFSKFAGLLGTAFASYGAFNAKDSIVKMATEGIDSATPQDLENIAYGLMALIGLKSFATARNKQTISKQANPTTTEHSITITDKNGKTHEVKVDAATAKEINNSYKFGRNNKTKSDAKTFNHEKVKKAVEEYNNTHTEKIDLEGASIQSSSKFGLTTEKPVKSNLIKNPNAPQYRPVGTRYWFNPGYMSLSKTGLGYWLGGGWQRQVWSKPELTNSNPNRGLMDRVKDFWNPKPIEIPKETNENISLNILQRKSWSEIEKEPSKWKFGDETKEFREILRGNAKHSGNAISPESFKVGNAQFDIDIPYLGATNGFINITLDGTKHSIRFDSLKELSKRVAEFIKENKSKIYNSSNSTTKVDTKKIGETLRMLKAKGVFKQGGTINNNLDTVIQDFFKNNNI